MYHFSPKTNKPEKCLAKDRSSCPFGGFPHDENLQVIQRYADTVNESNAYASENFFKYISKDWSVYSERPLILDNFSIERYKRFPVDMLENSDVRSRVFSNLREQDFNRLHNTDFKFFPKTQEAIQEYLSDINNSKEMFLDLKRWYEDGELGNKHGEAYERWELMEYLDQAKEHTTNQLKRKVNLVGPNGKVGYSTMDCWNDYIKMKVEKREAFEIPVSVTSEDGGKIYQMFYIVTVKHGPRNIKR